MSILDAIMSISGRDDPAEEMKKRIIAQGAVDNTATAAVPAVPPRIGSPQEPDPGADPNAPPAEPQPKAYQSIPDLAAMYQELMGREEKLQKRNQFMQGATLIAAGLARDENRNRIMSAYPDDVTSSTGSGLSGLSGLSTNILAMQKAAQEQAAMAQMRLALPKLAKMYGITLEEASALLEGGQWEEYIKTRRTPNPTVVERADKSKFVTDINAITQPGATEVPAVEPTMPSIPAADGTPVPLLRDDIPVTPAPTAAEPTIPGVELSPPAAPEPELIDDGKGGKRVAFKTPKGYVDTEGNPITEITNTTITHKEDGLGGFLAFDAQGKRVPDEDITSDQVEYLPKPDGKGGTVAVRKSDNTIVGTDEVYAGAEAPPRKVVYEDDPNTTGKIARYEDGTPAPQFDIVGKEDLIIEKTAEGQFQAINKVTGAAFGEPYGSKTATEPTAMMKDYVQARAAATARGEKFMDYDNFYDKYNRIGSPNAASANIDQNGVNWGEPEKGFQYQRDAKGNFVFDKNNAPIQVPTTGGTAELTAEEKEAAKKVSDREASEARYSVTISAERALQAIEEGRGTWTDEVGGLYGAALGMINPEGSRSTLVGAVKTIKANMAFSKLHAMRMSNPTGGALGNVSNEELDLLANTVINLDIGDLDVLKDNLSYIMDIVNDVPGAGQKYLKKIHEDRVNAALERGDEPPPPPPGLDSGGTFDDNYVPATEAAPTEKKKIVIDGVTIEEE